MKTPGAKPKALAFAKVEPGARSFLEHTVYNKNSMDSGKGASHHRRVICVE